LQELRAVDEIVLELTLYLLYVYMEVLKEREEEHLYYPVGYKRHDQRHKATNIES